MPRPSYRAPWLAAMVLLVAGLERAGAAEDELYASLRLRGGYDGNPRLLAAPRGSLFAGLDAVAVLGRKAADSLLGLVLEASHTRYRDAAVDPVQRYALRAQFEHSGDGIAVRATAALGYFANYETRAFEAQQTLRLQRSEGVLRPFVSASLGYFALNEVSAVLGEFLPDSQRFLRGTIIPGIAVKHGDLEVGVSVNLSATRYAEPLDLFGYRRDNERIEWFLFARYAGEKLSLFASLSRLYGDWHDLDFTDVRRTMFELSAAYRDDPFAIDVSATRSAADTTFPVSPVSVDTEISGRLTARLDPATRVAAFGRLLGREFPDSAFRSRQTTYGIELARDLGDELTLAAEISRTRVEPIVGGPLHATVASLSLARRYGAEADRRLRAGTGFPPARPSR